MSATVADPTALSGYQLRLPGFDGPLDVLLRLIERDQLAVTDVSLVAVTDQFLAYLSELGDVPPETVAEFAAVGGRLVLLKSRSLLPRPAAAVQEERPEDLVRQLVAYRAVKEAAELLGAADRRAAGAFLRGGGVALPPAPPPRLAIHRAGSLARALRRRLTAVPGPPETVAARPVVTLREMTERLLTALPGFGALPFGRFRAGCRDRQETLVAFLAVLVLVRRRAIEAEQEGLFGEITLRQRRLGPTAVPRPAPAPGGERSA